MEVDSLSEDSEIHAEVQECRGELHMDNVNRGGPRVNVIGQFYLCIRMSYGYGDDQW